MNNEILYILLPDYAAHEVVYLSQAIASDEYALKENPKYVNKVVAPTMEPVKSIGGFRTLPDYSFETMPDDYAALVLIGGFRLDGTCCRTSRAVCQASHRKRKDCRCNLQWGFFHGKVRLPSTPLKHTGNGLEQLKIWGQWQLHQFGRICKCPSCERQEYRDSKRFRNARICQGVALTARKRHAGTYRNVLSVLQARLLLAFSQSIIVWK